MRIGRVVSSAPRRPDSPSPGIQPQTSQGPFLIVYAAPSGSEFVGMGLLAWSGAQPIEERGRNQHEGPYGPVGGSLFFCFEASPTAVLKMPLISPVES
eukprot:1157009-Pelagomonas_calceolata.AAC.12